MSDAREERDRPQWDAASLQMQAENCRIRAQSLIRLTKCSEDFIWRPAEGAWNTLTNAAGMLEDIAEGYAKPSPAAEAGRPMTGFLATLTPKQREEALAYRGDDTHGEPALSTRPAGESAGVAEALEPWTLEELNRLHETGAPEFEAALFETWPAIARVLAARASQPSPVDGGA